ncbi:MAG: SDR family NAD(P)-dependent oxidoreductase [Pseudomonadales bacterium]
MIPIDLTGKVALITGGSRGLGRAMALGLADAGADIVVASRKLESCEAVCEEITAKGRKALAVAAHVGETASLDALIEAAIAGHG